MAIITRCCSYHNVFCWPRTSNSPLRAQTRPLFTQPAGTPNTPEPILRHRLFTTQGDVRHSFMSQIHTNTYTKWKHMKQFTYWVFGKTSLTCKRCSVGGENTVAW